MQVFFQLVLGPRELATLIGLKQAWDHFFRHAQLNGAIFFLDDLQNISISKSYLALMIGDQFQFFGIEGMNYRFLKSVRWPIR